MSETVKAAKHTPGPWVVVERKQGRGVSRVIWRADGAGTGITRIEGDPGPGEVNAANARLIAAAPALLEALERTLEEMACMDGEECDHAVGICWCSFRDAQDAARSAIALARGEQP